MLKPAFGEETMSRTQTSDKYLKLKNKVLSINDIGILGYPTTCRADENIV
jgi:hypothetical protein